MEINLIYGNISPINSITNPESTLILDFNAPFDFFTFLKHLKTDRSSSEYNDLYLSYLKKWSDIKENSKQKSDEIIKDYYLNLLKELTLNYFSIEEKRFISKIDFNDETDLDIVIPFYSRKIVEICDFFCKKREDLKFASIKNTFKGTESSLSRCIFETITDHLITDDEKFLADIKSNFDIEVEELYDFYQDYLNIDPEHEYTGNTELRKKYYTSNVNDVNVDFFVNFELSVKTKLLENLRTFLNSFKRNFTVNYNVNQIDLNCKVGDKLYEFVTERKDKATRQVELTSDLLKKYIGADYHYITVGETTTDVVSGILFKAENPTGNLLNRRFPSTATIEDDSDLRSLRKIGLLFTPEKNSILQFSVPEKIFKIDQSKLEPNKIYVYPDPSIYTNAEGKTKYDPNSPLVYVEKFEKGIRDASYGITQGDLKNNNPIQNLHGYKSKKDITQVSYFGDESVKHDFLSLHDKGALYKFSRDVYGNLFGLFKVTYKQENSDLRTPPELSLEDEQIFYGGPIKYRSGGFLPELVPPTSSTWVYPDVWSSEYYYNVAIDSGVGRIYDGKIPERGTDQYTGKFTISGVDSLSDIYVLSSIQYREMDGGLIQDYKSYTADIKLKDDLVKFINGEIKLRTLTATQIDNDETHQGGYFLKKSHGTIFVRNTIGEITPLSAAFSLLLEKYSQTIIDEINTEVLDFNIYGNTIWIRTSNYLIFENIKYENSKFSYSNTVKNKIFCNKNLSAFALSDPFIFENRSYMAFAAVEILNANSYEFSLIPQIYLVDKANCEIKKKFPFGNEDLTIFKNIKKENSDNDFYLPIKPKKVNSVSLTYNSRNDKYSIIAIIEDQNEMFYIFKTIFTFDGRLFTSESPTLTYMEFPTIIKTLNFLGNYTEFSKFINYNVILNNRFIINNDFFDLNNLTNTISGELLTEGEIKLYV